MKYYKFGYTNSCRKQYIKVYDSIPEEEPQYFKESKLIYVHEITIICRRGGHYQLENRNSYISKDSLDFNINNFWMDSTEEEFNKILKEVEDMEKQFKEILK